MSTSTPLIDDSGDEAAHAATAADRNSAPIDSGSADQTAPVGLGEYVVKPGDCITSIAKSTGHFWERIWDDPGNAELKAARQNPNVLLPADRVVIPAIQPRKEGGATEQRHRFVRRGEPALLRLQILDNNEPVANQPFELRVDGALFTGCTDPEGKLQVAIRGSECEALLTVGTGPRSLEYRLNLGQVEPIETLAGVRQRLSNLGYGSAASDGPLDETTQTAVRAFQRDCSMQPSGALDEPTRKALLERHGC